MAYSAEIYCSVCYIHNSPQPDVDLIPISDSFATSMPFAGLLLDRPFPQIYAHAISKIPSRQDCLLQG
jgi:hypothetical protein